MLWCNSSVAEGPVSRRGGCGAGGEPMDKVLISLMLMEQIRRSPVEVSSLSHWLHVFFASQVVVSDCSYQQYHDSAAFNLRRPRSFSTLERAEISGMSGLQ